MFPACCSTVLSVSETADLAEFSKEKKLAFLIFRCLCCRLRGHVGKMPTFHGMTSLMC